MANDKNIEAFEKWCADEMGNTLLFIQQMRNVNLFGGVEYKRDEINKRYRAWCAALRYMYANK